MEMSSSARFQHNITFKEQKNLKNYYKNFSFLNLRIFFHNFEPLSKVEYWSDFQISRMTVIFFQNTVFAASEQN